MAGIFDDPSFLLFPGAVPEPEPREVRQEAPPQAAGISMVRTAEERSNIQRPLREAFSARLAKMEGWAEHGGIKACFEKMTPVVEHASIHGDMAKVLGWNNTRIVSQSACTSDRSVVGRLFFDFFRAYCPGSVFQNIYIEVNCNDLKGRGAPETVATLQADGIADLVQLRLVATILTRDFLTKFGIAGALQWPATISHDLAGLANGLTMTSNFDVQLCVLRNLECT